MCDMKYNTVLEADAGGATRACRLPDGVKWIWFDLDDTLYDFAASSLIALRHVYEKYNFKRFFADENVWFETYHRHNAALWQLYNRAEITQEKLRFDRFYLPLREGGVEEEENLSLNHDLDVVYLEALGATGLLLDGAKEALAHLKSRGYMIGILSNGFSGVQHEKLRSSGIGHLVDRIVLSDDIGVNKPDRRIFDHALRQSGVSAGESLMIGDNPDTDIAGALRAGWNAMLYAPHSHDASVMAEGMEIPVLHHLGCVLNW